MSLRLKAPLPTPTDGIVIAALVSGATIRLRAQDIDYTRTTAAPNYVVVRPETSTLMKAADGRPYYNLTFSNRYTVAAWQDDVNADAAMPPSPTVINRTGLTYATYTQFTEGMTLEQGNQLFGFEAVEISRAEISGAKTVLYQWKQDSAVVVALFKDGRLFTKMPFALR